MLVQNAVSALLAEFICLYLWAPVRWSWNASSSGTQCNSSGTWSQLLSGEKHRSLQSGKTTRWLYVLGEGERLTESWAEVAGCHGHPPTSPAQPSREHQQLTATHHSLQPGPGVPESTLLEQVLVEEHFGRVTGVSERHWDTNEQTFGLPA